MVDRDLGKRFWKLDDELDDMLKRGDEVVSEADPLLVVPGPRCFNVLNRLQSEADTHVTATPSGAPVPLPRKRTSDSGQPAAF